METIKFRAYNKKTKEILSWEEITKDWGFNFIFDNENFILMQFTGLLDKRGKEIYENDILLNTTIKPQKIVIEFDKKCIGAFGGALKIKKLDNDTNLTWRYDMDKMEVIGNIYENYKLLKS